MAEFPALPLFTDAIIADTTHLSNEEFGAYMRLLMHIWRTPGCKIPSADAWVMRKMGVDESKFNALVKPLIAEFLQHDRQGNWLSQKRLSKEFEYVKKHSEKMTELAKIRWRKENVPCERNAPARIAKELDGREKNTEAAKSQLIKEKEQCHSNAPTPTPTPILKKDKNPPKPPVEVVLPDWLPKSVWNDFVNHRKKIKKPMSERAQELAIASLDAFRKNGHDPTAIVNASIINGWQGLFEPKKMGRHQIRQSKVIRIC